jgi:hypothetical protein
MADFLVLSEAALSGIIAYGNHRVTAYREQATFDAKRPIWF